MKKNLQKVSSYWYDARCDYENLRKLFGVSMYFSKKCNKKPDFHQVCSLDRQWSID